MNDHSATAGKKEVDIYRDTPVRLLGYANELGEAFRVWVSPLWVRLSYGVASVYVLADTADKTGKFIRQAATEATENEGDALGINARAACVAADTLLWQALASVAIPGFTINRVCAITLWTLRRYTALSLTARKRSSTAAGLGCIPLIVAPIDRLVDSLMNACVRPFLPTSTATSETAKPAGK